MSIHAHLSEKAKFRLLPMPDARSFCLIGAISAELVKIIVIGSANGDAKGAQNGD